MYSMTATSLIVSNNYTEGTLVYFVKSIHFVEQLHTQYITTLFLTTIAV